MADKKVPPKSSKATSVPPPKTKYIPPHEEVWSDATQAAVDRHLHGAPDNDRRAGDR